MVRLLISSATATCLRTLHGLNFGATGLSFVLAGNWSLLFLYSLFLFDPITQTSAVYPSSLLIKLVILAIFQTHLAVPFFFNILLCEFLSLTFRVFSCKLVKYWCLQWFVNCCNKQQWYRARFAKPSWVLCTSYHS